MKKLGLCFPRLIIFISTAQMAVAQIAAVKVIVNVPYDTATGKHVYVAGSFNGWKAGDSLYQLKRGDDGVYSITLPLFNDKHYEYKYTRGNWSSVEINCHDSDIHNRAFVSANGLVVTDTVAAWKKETKAEPSPQMARINAMKDSTISALQPQLNEMVNLLKSYVQNWLSDNPSDRVQKKLNKEAEKNINHIFEQIVQLLGNVMATLSPGQKAELKKLISTPQEKNDFINILGNGLQKVTSNSK
jgi:hypothetical protein